MALLTLGNGLSSTVVGVRGVVMSAFCLGFVAGSIGAPRLVQAVGQIRTFAALAALASAAALGCVLVVEPLAWVLLHARRRLLGGHGDDRRELAQRVERPRPSRPDAGELRRRSRRRLGGLFASMAAVLAVFLLDVLRRLVVSAAPAEKESDVSVPQTSHAVPPMHAHSPAATTGRWAPQ